MTDSCGLTFGMCSAPYCSGESSCSWFCAMPFFILLSYILVSEASLMSCEKKDWESPELPSWNDGLYPFTRKLRDVIISLILPLLFWQVNCAAFEQKGMEIFQWYRSFERKVLFMHDITATLEKVWGALRVTHTFTKKNLWMERKAEIDPKEWQKM